MADPEHLAKLKEGVDVWNEWRKKKPAVRPDLSDANLGKAYLQGANLKRAILQKAHLKGANLQKADLRGANLQKAHLAHANLQGAKLVGANLQGANLFNANLQGADIQGAKLRGANLAGATFQPLEATRCGEHTPDPQKANLKNADFRDTDLRDADLSDVIGLLTDKLAGADLSNAKLPPGIAKFEGLDHVSELSKHARNIFLAVIGGCVFSWLTIATTTDVALLTNSASTPLPIIQTKVPIAGFYWTAPVILLGLYTYLHLYLQRLWQGLAALPAVFPDGHTLDQRAYPWLLTSLVEAHVPRLKNERPPFSRLQVRLSIIAAWVLVPATLCLFWLRYLPRHDWIWTLEQTVLLALSISLAIAFYWRAKCTLRGRKRRHFAWKAVWKSAAIYLYPLLALGVTAVGCVISDGAIRGVPTAYLYNSSAARAEFMRISASTVLPHQVLVPKVFELFRSSAFLDLKRAKISKAILWDVNLRGADLWGADLQRADLRFANLQGAILVAAKLQRAFFANAELQGADLGSANLQGAILMDANLQGADLTNADLRGAILERADLRGVIFVQADLGGANLRGVRNLTQDQLDRACGDGGTRLPDDLTIDSCLEIMGPE